MKSVNYFNDEHSVSVLESFNNTKTTYSYNKVICDFFESNVKLYPEKTAIIGVNNTLTYKELNDKANQLARKLKKVGVKPDSMVGIMVERSCEMMIGIFAILKAGGAYLPMDPHHPNQRNMILIEDSSLDVLLTQATFNSDFFKTLVNVITLDDDGIYEGDVSNLDRKASPHDLAYVIYTSGSTGNPKGVLIENHSIINRIEWMQNAYPITTSDVLVQKTTYTFDVSVWELFWWAIIGSSVCLLPTGKEFDPRALIKLVEKHHISVMHFVPSVLRIFLDYIETDFDMNRITSLKWIFSSGEALSTISVTRFNTIFKENKTLLINLYGPTEAAVDVSHFPCYKDTIYEEIPIGKPIQNTCFHIVNERNETVAVGEVGELLISGAGLARGYLNNVKLTNECFVYNLDISEDVMYRTGDLAKWNTKGEVMFLGRIDYQVKLRGLRIELGEVEFYLLQFKEVKDCIVVVREDEYYEQYLTAFIVSANELMHTKTKEIKTFLKNNLPVYMVPNQFIYLEEFPLKPNGKVDRKQLLI